jgi:hypothetical protein
MSHFSKSDNDILYEMEGVNSTVTQLAELCPVDNLALNLILSFLLVGSFVLRAIIYCIYLDMLVDLFIL